MEHASGDLERQRSKDLIKAQQIAFMTNTGYHCDRGNSNQLSSVLQSTSIHLKVHV